MKITPYFQNDGPKDWKAEKWAWMGSRITSRTGQEVRAMVAQDDKGKFRAGVQNGMFLYQGNEAVQQTAFRAEAYDTLPQAVQWAKQGATDKLAEHAETVRLLEARREGTMTPADRYAEKKLLGDTARELREDEQLGKEQRIIERKQEIRRGRRM